MQRGRGEVWGMRIEGGMIVKEKELGEPPILVFNCKLLPLLSNHCDDMAS